MSGAVKQQEKEPTTVKLGLPPLVEAEIRFPALDQLAKRMGLTGDIPLVVPEKEQDRFSKIAGLSKEQQVQLREYDAILSRAESIVREAELAPDKKVAAKFRAVLDADRASFEKQLAELSKAEGKPDLSKLSAKVNSSIVRWNGNNTNLEEWLTKQPQQTALTGLTPDRSGYVTVHYELPDGSRQTLSLQANYGQRGPRTSYVSATQDGLKLSRSADDPDKFVLSGTEKLPPGTRAWIGSYDPNNGTTIAVPSGRRTSELPVVRELAAETVPAEHQKKYAELKDPLKAFADDLTEFRKKLTEAQAANPPVDEKTLTQAEALYREYVKAHEKACRAIRTGEQYVTGDGQKLDDKGLLDRINKWQSAIATTETALAQVEKKAEESVVIPADFVPVEKRFTRDGSNFRAEVRLARDLTDMNDGHTGTSYERLADGSIRATVPAGSGLEDVSFLVRNPKTGEEKTVQLVRKAEGASIL